MEHDDFILFPGLRDHAEHGGVPSWAKSLWLSIVHLPVPPCLTICSPFAEISLMPSPRVKCEFKLLELFVEGEGKPMSKADDDTCNTFAVSTLEPSLDRVVTPPVWNAYILPCLC